MSKSEGGLGGRIGAKRDNQKLYLANVWYSWHRFTDSIKNVCETEWNNKKQDVLRYFTTVHQLVEFVSLKLLIISALPMVLYLTIFNSYLVLKETFHLPEEPHLILPALEYGIFHCLPHQILARWWNSGFDILAAVPYLIHFPLPAFFIIYCVIIRKQRSVPLIYQYLWCVGWTNIVAVLIQFLFPTAPPWFNDSAVFGMDGEIISAAPNEAAFQRIDALIGIPWFKNLYGKSPLKYGSFPSLHVAWPTVVFLHQPWLSNKVGLAHVLWITWAALYSSHHYLIDAIGGISVVLIVKLGMTHVWEPFSKKKSSEVVVEPATAGHRYQRLSSCTKAV